LDVPDGPAPVRFTRTLIPLAAALLALAGGAYGGYHYMKWNPGVSGVPIPEINNQKQQSATAGFDEVDGRELFTVPGGGRVVTEASSIAGCRSSCQSESSCRGYEFNSTTLECRVFSQIARTGAQPSVYSGVKPEEKPVPVETVPPPKKPLPVLSANFDEQNGRELFTVPGGGRMATEVGSLAGCRSACREDASCRGFEFDNTTEVCRIFSEIARTGKSASVYSGIRR
jgi:hypothetical protein